MKRAFEVLSFRPEKQASKNIADTNFNKMFESIKQITMAQNCLILSFD